MFWGDILLGFYCQELFFGQELLVSRYVSTYFLHRQGLSFFISLMSLTNIFNGNSESINLRGAGTTLNWGGGGGQASPGALAAERLRPTGGTTDFWPQSFNATPIG